MAIIGSSATSEKGSMDENRVKVQRKVGCDSFCMPLMAWKENGHTSLKYCIEFSK